jgi:hypothetical protein
VPEFHAFSDEIAELLRIQRGGADGEAGEEQRGHDEKTVEKSVTEATHVGFPVVIGGVG